MRIVYVTILLLAFLLGWTGHSAITSAVYVPPGTLIPQFLGFNSAPEQISPSDHINTTQIHVLPDRIVLDIQNATWSAFTNTNSMDPFIDESSNGLEIRPESPEHINVGDVISYQTPRAQGLVIHRVIEKGTDAQGTYFIVKGDNNPTQDPDKVRFADIHGVLVGIIY